MIGVILAAGFGSRLRPLTSSKPKCLVTVAGKPILEHQFAAYRKAGIKQIYIIVGYEGHKIRSYCKHIHDLEIKIIENDMYEDTNNMYSLYLARNYITGQPFILNNADVVISEDLVDVMVRSEHADLVATDYQSFNLEAMKISCNSQGFIDDISKQLSAQQSVGCSLDFYKFSAPAGKIFLKEIERIICEDNNKKHWTEVALQRLFRSQTLKFIALNTDKIPWTEIDNYEDLALADELFSQQNKKLTDYQCYCFDLDGTVYIGNKVIPSVVSAIHQLKSQGKALIYISNNSSKSKTEYAEKLNKMGLPCTTENIKLSTDAVIHYLKKNAVKKVYVLGTHSLQQSIIEAGFSICCNQPDFIIVGYDTELTYNKLRITCKLINAGVDYIATHSDIFCPSESGPIPDIGTLLQLLESTTGIKPYKIFGKPNTDTLQDIIQQLAISPKNILVIGDRLATDIKMANDAKIDSVLVLSGDSRREDVEYSEIKPDYILPHFRISYR